MLIRSNNKPYRDHIPVAGVTGDTRAAFAVRYPAIFVSVAVVCLVFLGCQRLKGFTFGRDRDEAASRTSKDAAVILKKSAPLKGTVGRACTVQSLRSMFVDGYGLVGGLAGRGGGECPPPVREKLIQAITKTQKRMKGVRTGDLASASSIIASRDTAVVRVSGRILPMALKGERFDVLVEALPNTSTTSLAGGWLYACDLRVSGGPGVGFAKSKILARAAGPVFVNPFERKDRAGAGSSHRPRGYVLGGAVNGEDRRLSLVLNQPQYAMARAIEQRINVVFPPSVDAPMQRCAQAKSSGKIQIHIPRQYRDRKLYFLALLMRLPIQGSPGYLQRRASDMVSEIVDPVANAEAISFAWETMGRRILPLIEPLYRTSSVQASFYASRAGVALGDGLAIERMGTFARLEGPYQRKAVEQLGYSRDPASRRILREVAGGPDVDLRLLAYTGLVRMNDSLVRSEPIGDDNFVLDVVAAGRLPLVYVTRSMEPKVVIFGKVQIEPPAFYSSPDERIIITADSDDDTLTLVRKWPSGRVTVEIAGPTDLASFLRLLGSDPAERDGTVVGLGLSYGDVVAILRSMCRDGSIPARFKMEQVSGPPKLRDYSLGRPEKEEDTR